MTHNKISNELMNLPGAPSVALGVIGRGRAVSLETTGYRQYDGTLYSNFVGFADEDYVLGNTVKVNAIGDVICEAGATIVLGNRLGLDNVGRVVPMDNLARIGEICVGIACEGTTVGLEVRIALLPTVFETQSVITITAAEIIPANVGVTVDGYIYNGTTRIMYAGVSQNAAGIGAAVRVQTSGRYYMTSGGVIVAGQLLGMDATGRAVPLAAGIGGLCVGTALGNAGGAAIRTAVLLDKDALVNFESPQRGFEFYVDNTRVDAYTADGSFLKPFITIAAALDQIIANADNTADRPYVLKLAPSVYAENIVVDDALIVAITLEGSGSYEDTWLTGTFTCIVNNDATDRIIFKNLTMANNVTITGENTGTAFREVRFDNVRFIPVGFGAADSLIAITNITNLNMLECEVWQNLTVANIVTVNLDRVVCLNNTNVFTEAANNTDNIPATYVATMTINVNNCIFNIDPAYLIFNAAVDIIRQNILTSSVWGANDGQLTLDPGALIAYYDRRIIGITYNVAVHAGGIGDHVLGLIIPDNWSILRGMINITTALTSGGAATASLDSEGVGDLVIAAVMGAWAVGYVDVIPVGTAASAIRMTAERNITLGVLVDIVATGVFNLQLEVMPSI